MCPISLAVPIEVGTVVRDQSCDCDCFRCRDGARLKGSAASTLSPRNSGVFAMSCSQSPIQEDLLADSRLSSMYILTSSTVGTSDVRRLPLPLLRTLAYR